MKPLKIKSTVWLDSEIHQAAKLKAASTGCSLSETLAKAAEESLIRNRKDETTEINSRLDRVFYQLLKTDNKRGFEVKVIQEMLAVYVLAYFNHTPPIADSEKSAAMRQGKERFERYLNVILNNLMSGKSLTRHVPLERPE